MCEKSATGPRHPAFSIGFATMCGYGVCLSRRMATTCASHSHILFSTFMRFTVFKCFKLLRRIQATLTPSSQPQTHTDCHALPAHIPTGSTTKVNTGDLANRDLLPVSTTQIILRFSPAAKEEMGPGCGDGTWITPSVILARRFTSP